MSIEPVRAWTLRDKTTHVYIHQTRGRGAIPGHVDVWLSMDLIWQVTQKNKKWEMVAGGRIGTSRVCAGRGDCLRHVLTMAIHDDPFGDAGGLVADWLGSMAELREGLAYS